MALVKHQVFPLTIVVDKSGIVRFAKVGSSEENQAEAILSAHNGRHNRNLVLSHYYRVVGHLVV